MSTPSATPVRQAALVSFTSSIDPGALTYKHCKGANACHMHQVEDNTRQLPGFGTNACTGFVSAPSSKRINTVTRLGTHMHACMRARTHTHKAMLGRMLELGKQV